MMEEFCLGNKFIRAQQSNTKEISLQKQEEIEAKIKLESEINFMLHTKFSNLSLLKLDLSPEQIQFTNKIYKFTSIDQAVEIMLRDTYSNKLNHDFHPSKKNNQICGICREPAIQHSNFDSNEIVINNYNTLNISNREINNNDPFQIELVSDENKHALQTTRRILNTVNIVIPENIITEINDPLTCNICFDRRIEELRYKESSCNHKFCSPCITQHMLSNIYCKNVSLFYNFNITKMLF